MSKRKQKKQIVRVKSFNPICCQIPDFLKTVWGTNLNICLIFVFFHDDSHISFDASGCIGSQGCKLVETSNMNKEFEQFRDVTMCQLPGSSPASVFTLNRCWYVSLHCTMMKTRARSVDQTTISLLQHYCYHCICQMINDTKNVKDVFEEA